ncbi:MAG: hypothetical protein ABIF06_01975 [bacterium]
MFIPKDDLDWLKEHAEQLPDGSWRCKEEASAFIQHATTGRSIWIRPFGGGAGEVRMVTHLFCPEHNPDKMEHVSYGTPIYEDALVEVS